MIRIQNNTNRKQRDVPNTKTTMRTENKEMIRIPKRKKISTNRKKDYPNSKTTVQAKSIFYYPLYLSIDEVQNKQ